MPFESEYKLESVTATPVTADKINTTFRSSTIGEFSFFFFCLCVLEMLGPWGIRFLALGSARNNRDILLLSEFGIRKPPLST
jgi:hypothetical protein